MSAAPHAALSHSKAERMDYLRVLASMVGVDASASPAELGVLAEYCDALELTPAEKQQILAYTGAQDSTLVRETCERLRGSELRFTLVSDLLYIAHTDRTCSPQEREVIQGIARFLGISYRQLDAMESYATAVLRSRVSRLPGETSVDDADDVTDTTGNALAGLAGAGVPAVAVMVAGYGATGLNGTFTAGLAVLGGAGGMAAGVGVLAALGIGSFLAVRGLARALYGEG